jgi:hypothetical protein
MTKERDWRASLARLQGLPSDAPDARAELERICAKGPSLAVEKVALWMAERGDGSLGGALIAAFPRFLESAVKRDPGCRAKRAIAHALIQLEIDADDVWHAAVVHVQQEPVFGGREDTAAELRGLALFGLLRSRARDALGCAADLLADREPAARAGAARALAELALPDAALPLLRLRIRVGEPDPRVLGEYLSALMRLAPMDSLELVAAHLDSADPAQVEAAAFALAEHRSAETLQVLVRWLERQVIAELRRLGFLAVALLRTDAAVDYLLEQLAQADDSRAFAALAALELHREDAACVERVRAAVAARGDRELRAELLERFGPC